MRPSPALLLLATLACASAPPLPAEPALPPQPLPAQDPEAMPVHTQALIDAYQQRSALPAAPPAALPSCSVEQTPEQQRSRFYARAGACQDEPLSPGQSTLAAASGKEVEALHRALTPHEAELDRCVIEAQRSWPASKRGALVHQLDVSAQGRVTAIHVSDEGAVDPAVGCCVRSVLRSLQLPPTREPRAYRHTQPLAYDAATCRHKPRGACGAVSQEALRAEAQRHAAETRNCAEGKISSGGQITLVWTVGEDGKVASITVEDNSFPDRELACCLAENVTHWRFPPPHGVATISYPQRFSSF